MKIHWQILMVLSSLMLQSCNSINPGSKVHIRHVGITDSHIYSIVIGNGSGLAWCEQEEECAIVTLDRSVYEDVWRYVVNANTGIQRYPDYRREFGVFEVLLSHGDTTKHYVLSRGVSSSFFTGLGDVLRRADVSDSIVRVSSEIAWRVRD